MEMRRNSNKKKEIRNSSRSNHICLVKDKKISNELNRQYDRKAPERVKRLC